MNRLQVKSKVNAAITWTIHTDTLTDSEKAFIEQFNPTVYHNDQTSKLWAFDTKMPSERWLENIVFNNEMSSAKAIIL